MAMQLFTGFQWLLIDVANQYGHDKLTFEGRLAWAEHELENLEGHAEYADTKPLYIKAVMAIRKAQAGLPTGHLVGVDAVCSGIQIMSALTGCEAGATATGLIDPDVRADAYTTVTDAMNIELGGTLNVSRGDAKDAVMTTMYGSKAKPKEIFGEDTSEYAAFYVAIQKIAPGAWELLQDLLASWQPYALQHAWKLPDGFDARVKVMKKIEAPDPRSRIEVDELNHASFTYEFFVNEGKKNGLSNVANVVHSVDAYVLREMHRRCNYDAALIDRARERLALEILKRLLDHDREVTEPEGKVAYYVEQFKRSSMASAVILPYLDQVSIQSLPQELLEALGTIVQSMLNHKPFELVTVHDEFRAHPNNINQVRFHYKEILAELADGYLIDDLLSQLHGMPGKFNKLSSTLGGKIRNSNYALC